MSAVSLADVKAHLQMESSVNDVELQRFIDVAEAAIGTRVGPLTPVSVTEKHSGGGTCLVLKRPRAVSLTSIAYADGTTSTLADYDLDQDTAIVYWNVNTTGRFPGAGRNVTVTYTAGFASLPADLVHAVKELVRHLWETQRPNRLLRGASVDDLTPGAFSSWPIRVQELVAPYIAPLVG